MNATTMPGQDDTICTFKIKEKETITINIHEHCNLSPGWGNVVSFNYWIKQQHLSKYIYVYIYECATS